MDVMLETQTSNQKEPVLPFEFKGTGSEYFKIWIVNVLLTIITLGIYAAWAKVRTKRYFYGNTFFNHSNFEYHASPIAILKGRLIAIALLLAYIFIGNFFPLVSIAIGLFLFIIAPWIIVRSLKFNARMSSYRNVRFLFTGPTGTAYKYFFVIPLIPIAIALIIGLVLYFSGMLESSGKPVAALVGITVLATYILIPYLHKLFTAYYVNYHQYGQGQFSADLSAKTFYIIYGKLILWSLLTFIGIGILFYFIGGGAMLHFMNPSPMLGNSFNALQTSAITALIIPIYLLLFAYGFWSKAYLRAKTRNYTYGETRLGNTLSMHSTLKVSTLFGIQFTNFLLLILTLGLAYPWTKVRLTRYLAASTQAQLHGNISEFITQEQEKQSALGEELGEVFDIDVGAAI